jgi:hypothetical protein
VRTELCNSSFRRPILPYAAGLRGHFLTKRKYFRLFKAPTNLGATSQGSEKRLDCDLSVSSVYKPVAKHPNPNANASCMLDASNTRRKHWSDIVLGITGKLFVHPSFFPKNCKCRTMFPPVPKCPTRPAPRKQRSIKSWTDLDLTSGVDFIDICKPHQR